MVFSYTIKTACFLRAVRKLIPFCMTSLKSDSIAQERGKRGEKKPLIPAISGFS